MRTLKTFNNKLVYSFIAAVLLAGMFKTYLHITGSKQFEDSNLLVSTVLVLIATGCIFLILQLFSMGKRKSSK